MGHIGRIMHTLFVVFQLLKLGKYLQVRRTSYFSALRSFQIFTCPSFQIKLHLLSSVLFSGVQSSPELWNPRNKAVPGQFHMCDGQSKCNCLQDRAKFCSSGALQIVLIFNTGIVLCCGLLWDYFSRHIIASGLFNIAMTSHEHHDVINHRLPDWLFNSLFRLTSIKISKLGVIGPSLWGSTSEQWIPAQRASNAERVAMWWHIMDTEATNYTVALVPFKEARLKNGGASYLREMLRSWYHYKKAEKCWNSIRKIISSACNFYQCHFILRYNVKREMGHRNQHWIGDKMGCN